jgi:hypothetical protein
VTEHGPRQFGEGPLSVVASFIYTLLVVGFCLVLASAPSIALLAYLAQDISNVPLAAASMVPVGPAVSAAVYALHHRRRDLTQLRPFRQYWYAYRLNVLAVLPVWLIGLAWLTIVGVTLANFWASGFPRWYAVLLLLIAMVAALWTSNAIVISSLFTFRVRDVIRLAWEMIPRVPRATLGTAGVIAGAALFAYATSELLLVVVGVIFVLILVNASRPMVELVTAEYTEHP